MTNPFPIDPEDLEGSILGEVLDEFVDTGVYEAPLLGVNFVKPWPVVPDA